MPETSTYQPDNVSPPGDTLADLLDERGMSQAELATRLGRPRKTVNEIVKGKAAIEPDTALQLEAVLGTPAAFWLAREARYREWLARSRRQDTLDASTTWARSFPYVDMARWGWVPAVKPAAERGEALLRYFGVASPAAWKHVWSDCEVAFRKPQHLAAKREALAAWLRRGEIEAQAIDCVPFDRNRLQEALQEARGISLAPAQRLQADLRDCFRQAGVAFVVVPEIKGASVSGATRWISDRKALIQVSLRYKSDDQLFFSIFHEAAHVLLHPRKAIFIEGAGTSSKEEQEADVFAADALIPRQRYDAFVEKGAFLAGVHAVAREIGIAPGIVVGRLQHDGHLAFTQGNQWKRRFTMAIERSGDA